MGPTPRTGGGAFIFVGGIQPKKVKLSDQPTVCPRCGLPIARRMRQDYYFSLFFIPVFPVKRGEEVLVCERCGENPAMAANFGGQPRARSGPRICTRCDRELQPEWDFCPHCGQRNA